MHSDLEKAVKILEAGGLVAIPTETVYGLAADAENEAAVKSIYAAKNRPATHPLIVHVASAEALPYWAREIPEDAKKLTEAFWPGPLTIVLKRFDAGKGRGLAAPSANTFGKISPTTAQHVRDDLGEKPEGKTNFILDGGECTVGIESTILDLTGEAPRILREGDVSGEMISKVIGKPVEHGAIGASPRVSGSMKSHYAPEHVLKIVSADDLPGETQFLARHFKTFSLIAPEKIAKRFSTVAEKVRGYKDAKELQVNLYKWLHELDHDGGDVIFAVEPELTDSSAGVLDRLTRAAAERPNKESK